MSSERPKRHVTVPKKFSIEEGYTLPDSPEGADQQRVLRFLNGDDLERKLQDLTVYVLWPEDKLWYEAVIQKPSEEGTEAKLFYTETAEEEVIDLTELINEKQIAFLEWRPANAELKEDELLADNLIHVAQEATASEASDSEGESSGQEGSQPTQDELHDGGKATRSRARYGQALERDGAETVVVVDATQMLMPGMGNENSLYGLDVLSLHGPSLIGRSQSGPEAVGGLLNGVPSKKMRSSASLLRQTSSGSKDLAPPLRLDVMTKLREKTIEQLKAVLEQGQEPPTSVEDVAQSIEIEMMKLCGGENNDYKSKLRTLYFNLKDARNPELRRRVLNGEIPPEQLVSMSAKDLASQELVQWRMKKKEELLQATLLDEDAAAQFSTAAALKQLETKREELRREQRDSDVTVTAVKDLPVQLAVETVPDEVEEKEAGDLPEGAEFERSGADEAHEIVTTNAPTTEDAVMDLGEIPDWAMEVVETPPPVQPAPVLYSPKAAEERNNSAFGPVPIRQNPPDLTPLFLRDDGTLVVGQSVWQGEIGFAEQPPFKAQCIAIAGKCDLRAVLTSPQIVVQGRMQLKKVEDFLEKLRTSKSRSVTIGILRPPIDATDDDIAAIQENVHYYLSRAKTGAMELGKGVEGYLIAQCSLTGRLLQAAQTLLNETERIPPDIDVNEFLLVAVHKKDWTPPVTSKIVETVVPAPPPTEAMDPRIRAGLKPVGMERRELTPPEPVQSLPTGLTLESISNLAAMLGVHKQSLAIPSAPPGVTPHQMSVPAAVPAASQPPPEVQQQPAQTAAVVQPERPKFLIFDPVHNKALPLNPASIQYDPGSNRALILGPLPQGFAVQQLAATVMEASVAAERLMTHTQAMPLMMNIPQEPATEAVQMEEAAAGFLAPTAALIPAPAAVLSNLPVQPMSQAMVQPMNNASRRGRSGFRRRRGSGFSQPNPLQSFPESSAPL